MIRPTDFRYDINALRAAAVIAVIAFHYDASLLPGGFVGVDVFFVISGYLMTGIILKGLHEGNFSILSFYLARARRILPALALLSGTLLAMGYAFLLPKDFHALSEQVLSSLTFTSNQFFHKEADYFSPSAREQWLLHTWSLAIEWQFYLIFPLTVVFAVRLSSIAFAKGLLLAVTVLGFAHSLVLTDISSSQAFYSFMSRSWELSLGGLAYVYPLALGKWGRRTLAMGGWTVLVLCCALLNEKSTWPGYLALAPTLGAFAIIQAQIQNGRLIRNRVVQTTGQYSYSLYLWHWPLLVGSVHFNWNDEFIGFGIGLLALSAASFHLLEQRRLGGTNTLTFALLVLGASMVIIQKEGLKYRVADEFRLTAQQYHQRYYGGAGYPADTLFRLGNDEKPPAAIFMGDSYGLQYARSLDQFASERGLSISALFDHGCLSTPNLTTFAKEREDLACSGEYAKLHRELDAHPNAPLILAFSWEHYRHIIGPRGSSTPTKFPSEQDYHRALIGELMNIVEHGGATRRYFLIGSPQPTKIFAFSCLARAELPGAPLFGACTHTEKQRLMPFNEVLRRHSALVPNLHFVDPNDLLCTDGVCVVIEDGHPVHSDRVHLSVYGAHIVAQQIIRAVGLGEGAQP